MKLRRKIIKCTKKKLKMKLIIDIENRNDFDLMARVFCFAQDAYFKNKVDDKELFEFMYYLRRLLHG